MEVEPRHLSMDLIQPAARQSVLKLLTLRNTSEERRAFKIRTTARERFSTTPNSGIIEAFDFVEVLVTMLPLNEDLFESLAEEGSSVTDKFLVRDCPAPEDTTEAEVRGENASQWWDARDKVLISDHIVTVGYLMQASRCEVATPVLFLRKESVVSDKMVGSSRVMAETALVLINNTASKHAFKIRTTARDRYRVEPSCGIVDVAGRFNIRISMVQPRASASDKFQVRCCSVGHDVTEADVKGNTWWTEEEVKPRLYDTTLDSQMLDTRPDARAGNDSHRPSIDPPQIKPRTDGLFGSANDQAVVTLAALPSEVSNWDGAEGRYDSLLKIVLVGDSNVGKTSLLTRFADDHFSDSFISTIGVDFKVRTLNLGGKIVKLQIWDTAGQERFRTITSAYYRGADGIIVIYDVTSEDSFKHVGSWMKEISRYSQGDQVKVVVVGNKSDQVDQRVITNKEAQEYCKSIGTPLIETSARSADHVLEAFSGLASRILSNTSDTPQVAGQAGRFTPESEDDCCACLSIAGTLRKFTATPFQGYTEYNNNERITERSWGPQK